MIGRRTVTITAGETIMSTWCATCQLPTRIRIPLHDGPGGPLLAELELCPGCGANHATPMITVTPAKRGRASLRHPVATIATAANRRDCEQRGLMAVECAYGDCRMPGQWDCTWKLRQDEGTTTYLFCKPGHRTDWLEEHGFLPEGG